MVSDGRAVRFGNSAAWLPKADTIADNLNGKAFTQGGRKHLRDALWMPAIVALGRNPDLKAVCHKLCSAGKHAKVASTALMRKRVELANTLVKADRVWV